MCSEGGAIECENKRISRGAGWSGELVEAAVSLKHYKPPIECGFMEASLFPFLVFTVCFFPLYSGDCMQRNFLVLAEIVLAIANSHTAHKVCVCC